MDFTKLEPFLAKFALDTSVNPTEVAAILQRKQQQKQQNKNPDNLNENETFGVSQPLDDNPGAAENTEGELLEKAFPELEVENALEEAKENKPFANDSSNTIKSANYWDLLRQKYGNDRR